MWPRFILHIKMSLLGNYVQIDLAYVTGDMMMISMANEKFGYTKTHIHINDGITFAI